ncbi:TnpV protein [Ethanoligenens sp.]|uniref:TnpV protein n=1 Tax=Ethanoligenens sp. TaxID=2099655 RepID=UPI0039E99D30
MKLNYTKHGRFLSPEIQISNDPRDDCPLGNLGKKIFKQLKLENKWNFTMLLVEGELMGKMHRAEETANQKLPQMIEDLMSKEQLPEDLDLREQRMREIRNQAEEQIIREMVQSLS